MDKTIIKSLELLGVGPLETKFFLTSFKMGPAGVNEIAKAARMRRSTAYVVVQNLISQGLIVEDHKEYGKKIMAIDPAQILRLVSAKERLFRRQEIELGESLPQLRAVYQASETHPKVRFYEGQSGLMQVWQDILSTKGEILLWTNQQTENQFFGPKNHDRFIAERLNKRIPIRVLATFSAESKKLVESDASQLRHTKVLPSSTTFSAETYLYDNKVAILDYNKDIIGVIIESVPISQAQRAMFELAWHHIQL